MEAKEGLTKDGQSLALRGIFSTLRQPPFLLMHSAMKPAATPSIM
jgi:hypothetical protein